jgi:hypothetical protein
MVSQRFGCGDQADRRAEPGLPDIPISSMPSAHFSVQLTGGREG